jgi:tryptophan 2,3-dioxygenase
VPNEQTYASYLRIDDLLQLQVPRSEPVEHDEILFIVIHQTYELWFKQVLHECEWLIASLDAGDGAKARHTFKRILTILKTLVGQVDVLETMTPIEFTSFRARLESASGFQSRQFRCLELLLGKRDPKMLQHLAGDAVVAEHVAKRTLHDAFLGYLARAGAAIPQEAQARAPEAPIVESDAVRAALVQVYRTSTDLADLCERMVDLDEGLQEWRYRHVKMVERTIGFKRGTGGSAGAEYLRTTLFRPLFADLWAIRSEL